MKFREALFWQPGALTGTGISVISIAFGRKPPTYEVKHRSRDRVQRRAFSAVAA